MTESYLGKSVLPTTAILAKEITTMRTKSWKSIRPTSLSEAMQLCIDYASAHRRPIKVLADLMGVELKTLYRWLSEVSMPLNRVRQFESFCGVSYVSEYLCMAAGDKVVIHIPTGKKARVIELAQLQAMFADAMSLLVGFYEGSQNSEDTVAALTNTLIQVGYQRQNVVKVAAPELDFGA